MSIHREDREPASGTLQLFNDVLSPLAFRPPERQLPGAWTEHISFAFWIVEQTVPQLLVEFGTRSGNSYLAFCQAVQALGLTTRCYAADTTGDAHSGSYGEEVFLELAGYHNSTTRHFRV